MTPTVCGIYSITVLGLEIDILRGEALLLAAGMIGFALYHLGLAIFFWGTMAFARPTKVDDASLPEAVVFLTLRGADPSLRQSLVRLFRQDYPRFRVRIAVDSRTDPAWEAVEAAIADAGATHVSVEALERREPTASLKCNAMVQLIENLDDEPELYAFADGDMMPHSGWLRELAAPIARDPRVGLATGGQWFFPERPDTASLLRSLWNAGAIVATFCVANPWAGSCAIRGDLFRKSGLLEMWKKSAVDDGPMRKALKAHGVHFAYVPMLVMVNQEICTLPFLKNYLRRMMVWSRLYEPIYLITIGHATLTSFLFFGSIAWAALCLAFWRVAEAGISIAGAFCFWFAMWALFAFVESGVRRVAKLRAETMPAPSLARFFKVGLLVPWAQWLYLASVYRGLIAREVAWRGVRYRVDGPYSIRRLDDPPVAIVGTSETSI